MQTPESRLMPAYRSAQPEQHHRSALADFARTNFGVSRCLSCVTLRSANVGLRSALTLSRICDAAIYVMP